MPPVSLSLLNLFACLFFTATNLRQPFSRACQDTPGPYFRLPVGCSPAPPVDKQRNHPKPFRMSSPIDNGSQNEVWLTIQNIPKTYPTFQLKHAPP
jgi:hypothetical protein